ncbi:MAG: hypothetical protein HZA93_28475 [Verrucomicrobia bacterium]|nr:hypothetical protein [Verrucomicrobiota bacterium]
MSIAELKETAERLSPEERKWMRRHLALLDQINDPTFIEEMTRRNRAMAAGDFITREEVLASDAKLRAEGR